MAAAVKLHFFLDENIPDSIGRYLQGRGHSVLRSRYHISLGSPDPVVATTAMQADRILVSLDKDFNSQRFLQPRFNKLRRIALSGHSTTLLPALKKQMPVLEFALNLHPKGARITVHIKEGQIRIRTD